LKEYNPELLDKSRLLAITKSDLLDDELMGELKKELPKELPHVFISSLTQYNINELKDMIWKAINA
jgi:GTP-binding protein